MASNKPFQLMGTAPEASYCLLRTEDSNSEFPVEEDYWVAAAEFADRQHDEGHDRQEPATEPTAHRPKVDASSEGPNATAPR